ncbi:MAG: hypothetical protein LIQ31_03605 [Planctomycetes bacterium]|nr:hypothetical protein [Planctomycetota bacterium]
MRTILALVLGLSGILFMGCGDCGPDCGPIYSAAPAPAPVVAMAPAPAPSACTPFPGY